VIGRRTHPQAQRELPPPPTSTGIDYLKLLSEQRDAELGGQRIDFASLANDSDGDGDGDGDGDSDGDSDSVSDSYSDSDGDGDGDGEDRDINQQEDGQ
jgi:hypothetical protein